MKSLLPRRILVVVAALCLVFVMLPMAIASPQIVTTGDAVQTSPPTSDTSSEAPPVAPSTPDIPSVEPSTPDTPSVEPSTPDTPSAEPSTPEEPPAAPPIAPPATDIPSAEPPAASPNELTTNSAVAIDNGFDVNATLTVEFNASDNNSNTSFTNNGMKTVVENAAPHGAWRNVGTIKVTGNATEITGYNWDYLRAMMFYLKYGGKNPEDAFATATTSPSKLDLSGMTSLTTIWGHNPQNPLLEGSENLVLDAVVGGALHATINDFTPRTVILPDSLTITEITTADINPFNRIKGNIFKYCVSLQTVQHGTPAENGLPTHLQSVGKESFSSCKFLVLPPLPDSITSIGESAFQNCSELLIQNLPSSLTTLGKSAFSGAKVTGDQSTQTLTIPPNLKVIPFQAFTRAQIHHLNFPSDLNMELLDDFAFYLCDKLETIALPQSAAKVGVSVFGGCTKLDSIAIPSSFKIGALMFSLSGVKTVTVTGDGAVLGKQAFSGCTSLDSVLINGKRTTLETKVFDGCTALKTVTATNTDPETGALIGTGADGASFGGGAFQGCKNLDTVNITGNDLTFVTATTDDEGHTIAPVGTFKDAFTSSDSATVAVTIEGNNAIFGKNAFQGCKKLTAVTVNGNGANFGDNAFLDSFAESTDAASDVSVKVTGDGAIFGKNAFQGCKKLRTVTVIGDGADFGDNAFLTSFTESTGNNVSVTVNSNNAKFGANAFKGCNKLRTVSVTGNYVKFGANAFEACKMLTSVTVTGANPQIGEKAFLNSFANSPDDADNVFVTINCTAPTESIPTDFEKPKIGMNAFQGCKKLRNVTITGDKVEIGNSAFLNSFAESTTGESTSVTLIGDDIVLKNNVFDQCIRLQSVTGGGQKLKLGNLTFNECNALTNVELRGKEPGSVSHGADIGDNTFNECNALTTITINASDMKLGVQTFNACKKLAQITVKGSKIAFGEKSFNGCVSLKTVEVAGDNVTFGSQSFFDCSALTDVNVSGGYTKFGENAFTNCGELKNLNITGEKGYTTLGSHVFVNCPKVTNLVLMGKNTILDEYACAGNSSIESVTAPGNNLQVGKNAFAGCGNLITVVFGGEKPQIGDSAFAGCVNLKSANLKGMYPVIGDYAFDGDILLETVTFKENSSPKIGNFAYRNCTLLQSPELTGEGATIGNNAFENSTTIKNVTLSDKATIGKNAFSGCTNLTSVSLGKNTQIKEGAFQNCKKLGGISLGYNSDRPFDGFDIENNAFQGSGLKTVTITGDSVKIDANAFQDCKNLTTLELPGVSPQIGANAFADCNNLKETDQNGSTTLLLQGKPAPNAASNISAFSLETGGPVLGENAFAGTKFEEVKFTGASPEIGAGAFQGCDSLKKVWFNFSDDLAATPYANDPPKIGANAFAGCTKLQEVWFDSNSPAFSEGATPENCFPDNNSVFFGKKKMQDQGAFGDIWNGMRDNNRLVIYDESSLIPAQFTGIKESYNVWDTLNFEVKASDIKNAAPGQLRAYPPVKWECYAPSKTADPWNQGEAPYYPGASWTAGGPYTGVIYPAKRPYGIWTARAYSNVQVFYRDGTTPAGQAGSWHDFNRWGNGQMPNELQFEFLPPPIPAEANYQLTVLGGGGSGYYAADVSAPLSPKPPVSGAKFLRWELKSGTGKLADPASPQTRFTMAVGPSTVEAVYDISGAGKPVPTPTPTPSPPTGDPGLPGAAALLLLAAGVGLGWSKTLRRAKAPAMQREK